MDKRTTEQDSRYPRLDSMSTRELLEGINAEDRLVPEAVSKQIPVLERVVDNIVGRMRRGGRVFYLGAGTSGRLGVVDASEIPPTYGVKGAFIGLIAGGDGAIRTAVEGAEDDRGQGWKDIMAFNPTVDDSLVGIAASGSTPYVVGAIEAARSFGMFTSCICCNRGSDVAAACEMPIEVVVGPEFVTGSTRMKAGTCQKLVLNMISTSVMIKLGHVKGCRMVDMQPTNSKLVDRGSRMIAESTGLDYDGARALLLRYGSVRDSVAVFERNKK